MIVGNNVGAPGEGRLRDAEADARKMLDVLLTLGEFRCENAGLLLGDSVAAFDRVLIALNARIRGEHSQAGYAIDMPWLSIAPRVGACRSRS